MPGLRPNSTLRSASQSWLDRRLVIREVTTGLDDLAQLHVQTFYGVRGVHDPSNLRREHVERYDVLPCPLPRLHDGRVFLAPRAVSEVL